MLMQIGNIDTFSVKLVAIFDQLCHQSLGARPVRGVVL